MSGRHGGDAPEDALFPYGLFVLVLRRIPRNAPPSILRQSAVLAFVEAGETAARHPVIGPLLWLHIAFSLLMRPLIDLLPAVSGQLVGGGPEALGLLTAAAGFGAFAGSLWLTWRSGSPQLLGPVLVAAILVGLTAIALAASAGPWQAAACFAVLGGALVVRAAGSNTVVQLMVKDDQRSRVMALWGTVLRIGSGVGGLLLGAVADWVGMQIAIVGAGVLALAVTMPILRRLHNHRTE